MSSRSNDEWLADLRASGPAREAALTELRALVLKGLPFALAPYRRADDPHFDALVEATAQETLLRVLDRLDSFEGRSQFTTWVYTIAVRLALTELRRRQWRDVSLDSLVERETGEAAPQLMADKSPGPEAQAEQADLVAELYRLIDEELTDRQRRAMLAMLIGHMPLEEIARQMGTQRNALYKLLHDARLRLKRRLERDGWQASDVLAVFERG